MQPYERIKYLRKDILKKSQEDFAEAVHISRSNLGNIETGRISLTDRVAGDICTAFDINKDWLITGEGEIFVELSPDEEFAKICAEVINDNDEFAMRLLKSYWNLSDDGRIIIQHFLDTLSGK